MNPRISIDPKVQHGRPVIKGTRVPVVRILGELAGGTPREEICVTSAPGIRAFVCLAKRTSG